jgi:hypothetical protein
VAVSAVTASATLPKLSSTYCAHSAKRCRAVGVGFGYCDSANHKEVRREACLVDPSVEQMS